MLKTGITILISILAVLSLSIKSFAQSDYIVKLYTTSESLTLYVEGDQPINLDGLGFEVLADDQRVTFYLSDFPSFSVLRLERVPVPICLRLELSGSSEPLPQNCQVAPTRTLIHAVTEADIFWFDPLARQARTIVFVRRAEVLDFCPAGQSECEIGISINAVEQEETSSELEMTPTASRNIVPELLGTVGYPVLQNSEWTPIVRDFDTYPMVFVPTGCFLMGDENGSLDERPVHQQCIDQPFWLDQYEVSNAQWGSPGAFTASELPRDSITWYEARTFCQRRGARLPTEVEWEYAAKGPSNLTYPWGDAFVEENANAFRYEEQGPEPVTSHLGGVSWVGSYNMTGNVWEWTSSIYSRSYPYTSASEDPDNTMLMRVLRGGSWRYEPIRVRSAYRGAIAPSLIYDDVGVRCAQTAGATDPN